MKFSLPQLVREDSNRRAFNALYLSTMLLLISVPVSFLRAQNQKTEEFEPLYAGTLLSFYPENALPGCFSVQPYIFSTQIYGAYEKNWSVLHHKNINTNTLLLSLETGITDWLDVNLIVNGSYNHFSNQHSWLYGDTVLYFGFQILHDQRGEWTPDLRLLIGETFPTGRYQRLDRNKLKIAPSGAGSFQTSAILIIRKIFYTYPHPFNFNLNLYYIFPASTGVHGFNFYGGGPHTRGTVHPGNIFVTNLAFELSLNQYWQLGLDIRYEHQNKSPFTGKTLLPTGLPSSERFSLAPCIEYTFNQDLSLATGVWFSVAGRNNNAFASWVANVFYMF